MKQNLKPQLKAYLEDTRAALKGTDYSVLNAMAGCMLDAREMGKMIFTAGNGGSSATASHMVNDLIKGCRVYNRVGFRAMCLTDSNAVLTCLSNDISYEQALSVALKTLAHKGDVLIVFSGSGNSENLVACAKTARAMGIAVLGFLGRDGGALKPLCDVAVIAPSDCMEQIEDLHMAYEHAIVSALRGYMKDMWDIEVIKYPEAGRKFKSALFDFDGTISLIRQGWQQVMIPYFIEVLRDTPKGKTEPEESLYACTREFVDRLTGKQTIFQCMALDDEAVKRGGPKRDPMIYKNEYLRRLMVQIKDRLDGLRSGAIKPEEMMVAGSVELIKQLKRNGISVYLASGTDQPAVRDEAALLGIDKYFDGHVYGALDEHATACTKEIVIKRILAENKLTGADMLSFGDGFVEIELVYNIGGYAIAVATDEAAKKGIDEWKRERLISAGASAVIPTFTGAKQLLSFLKGNW